MIIKITTSLQKEIEVSISNSCYDRCESYINEYRLYLADCNINNDDDFKQAHINAGRTRTKLHNYLLALYDLGFMTLYENAELRRYYSDRITTLYELWIEG